MPWLHFGVESRYRQADATRVETNPEEPCCDSCADDMAEGYANDFDDDYCCCVHGHVLDGESALIDGSYARRKGLLGEHIPAYGELTEEVRERILASSSPQEQSQ